jgi:hypothetical protein
VIALVVFIFGVGHGVWLAWAVFADHCGERGEFVLSDGDAPSHWVHDGIRYLPEPWVLEDAD